MEMKMGMALGTLSQPWAAGSAPTPPGAILLDFAAATLDGGGLITSVPNTGAQADIFGPANDVGGGVAGGSGAGIWTNGNYSQFVGTEGGHVIALHALPDATNPGGAPGEAEPGGISGFTCTGMCKIIAGAYAGSWAINNFGLAKEGTTGTYAQAPEVVIVSADFSTVLASFPTASTTNLQGIACDASGLLWVGDGGPSIRAYTQAGVASGTVDCSALATAASASGIGGIAYVPATDELVVIANQNGGPLLGVIDATAKTAKTMSLASPFSSGGDQLGFDPADNVLYMTTGGNGSPGKVERLQVDATGSTISVAVALLPEWTIDDATAIEGIVVESASGRAYVATDGGYHLGTENEIVELLIPSSDAPSTFVIGLAMTIAGGPARRPILLSGDGVYGQHRIELRKEADHSCVLVLRDALTGETVEADWTGADLSAMTESLMIVVDVDAQTAVLYVDGVSQGDGATTFEPVEPIAMSRVRIGSNDYNKSGEMEVSRFSVGTDPTEVQAWLEAG